MELPDWTDLELYHYLVIGGGVLVVVALVGYFFFKDSRVKVPAGVVGVVASLALGIGLGVLLMAGFGYRLNEDDKGKGAGSPPPRMGPGMGMMGGGGGGGGMMGGAPSSKMQLATLVTKLDQLTSKSLTLSLSDDQKKVIAEQTNDLLTKKELEEKDAKTRLDALLKALEKDKATFAAAGYRWPAQRTGGRRGGGPGGMMQPPREEPKNPFKEKNNEEHLKKLREQVGPGKPTT